LIVAKLLEVQNLQEIIIKKMGIDLLRYSSIPYVKSAIPERFPDRTISKPDTSPTDNSPKTIPRLDDSPTGQFLDQTIPRRTGEIILRVEKKRNKNFKHNT